MNFGPLSNKESSQALKSTSHTSLQKKGMANQLQRLIAKRNRHYSKYRATGSCYHKDKYKQTKAQLQKCITSSSGYIYVEDIATSPDLARNEEFSKIAELYLKKRTVLKKQLSVGVFCWENFEINHANQQFNICLLTCKQTRKIYEHSQRYANTLHPAKKFSN